jgi:hypothetical protein
MERCVLQVVPGAPPMINGVGDYSLSVAREMRNAFGVNSVFLVCAPGWRGTEQVDGFRMFRLASRAPGALRDALNSIVGPSHVLLQLSPYGFHESGSPFWLLHGLRDWLGREGRGAPLLTYFHELYASGPPWSRAFWYSALQRRCTRGFLRLSARAFTSLVRYRDWLERRDRRKRGRITCLPVPSNVGEMDESPAGERRLKRLVIWGSTTAKRDIYERHGDALARLVRAAAVREIVDVGPPADCAPASIGSQPVHTLGVLPPGQLDALLASSSIGAFSYNPAFLGKSGVFAAFCAHGVPAMCFPNRRADPRTSDGLRSGVHFLSPGGESFAPHALHDVGRAASAWYRTHSIRAHARAIAQAVAA